MPSLLLSRCCFYNPGPFTAWARLRFGHGRRSLEGGLFLQFRMLANNHSIGLDIPSTLGICTSNPFHFWNLHLGRLRELKELKELAVTDPFSYTSQLFEIRTLSIYINYNLFLFQLFITGNVNKIYVCVCCEIYYQYLLDIQTLINFIYLPNRISK